MNNSIVFPLILFGVFLNAAAQLALKAGMIRIGTFTFTLENLLPIGLKAATTPAVLAGLLCYGVSVIIWMMVLSRIEVGIAYPLVSLGYIITAIAAYFMFNEPLTATRIIGIVVIMVGVYLITRS